MPSIVFIYVSNIKVCLDGIDGGFISLSGLHSLIEICANGIIVVGVTYLVSCCCFVAKWAFIKFEKCLCCLLV